LIPWVLVSRKIVGLTEFSWEYFANFVSSIKKKNNVRLNVNSNPHSM
jgi:hypothetical protein